MIYDAISLTDSKSTSPQSLKPFFFVLSGMRLTPTSITVAPGFTISAVTVFGLPTAAMRMSACLVISARFFVPV